MDVQGPVIVTYVYQLVDAEVRHVSLTQLQSLQSLRFVAIDHTDSRSKWTRSNIENPIHLKSTRQRETVEVKFQRDGRGLSVLYNGMYRIESILLFQ